MLRETYGELALLYLPQKLASALVKLRPIARDDIENMSTHDLRQLISASVDIEVVRMAQQELAFRKQFAEASAIRVTLRNKRRG
ncbi:MAG TPA: hypothetical protein VK629_20085 [Steroidobacteraceae bacterium]|nr:hypothetical protein [Steroidobacteraceae bacterium]